MGWTKDVGKLAARNAQEAANKINEILPEVEGFKNLKTYNPETIYSKNNIVEFEGSSYLSLVDDNVGNAPTIEENDYWSILARKGLDGKGSVVTVNGVSPDVEGNVELEIATSWNNLNDKPTTFTPSPHTHEINDVNELQSTLDLKAGQSDLEEVSNKINVLMEEMTPLPPVEEVLNRGQNNIIAEHQSLAKMKLLEGKTIVNLVPLFDSGAWYLHANAVVTEPNVLTLNADGIVANNSDISINVKPSTTYTIIVTHNATVTLFVKNATGTATQTLAIGTNTPVTFTTDADTKTVVITVGDLRQGTFTFENIMLNEGTTALPFVANVKGITNPTIENKTNGSVTTLKSTFHEGEDPYLDGQVVKVERKKREVVLDEKIQWVFNPTDVNGTGNKQVSAIISGVSSLSSYLVKYNGKIIQRDLINSPLTDNVLKEVYNNGNLDGGTLWLTIPNEDSGWGDSYTPTADEIKAYFLGWKMYPYGGNALDSYTTGIKGWAKKELSQGGYVAGSGTDVLPTVQNEGFPNYRLIYDLATPYTEIVETVGTLTLEKGENTLEVSEGRIVKEVAKPQRDKSTGIVYYINVDVTKLTGVVDYWQQLDYKTSSILQIYRNDEIDDSWELKATTSGYGGMFAEVKAELFDPTAVYTVDYIPLYPFEVTAPLDTITIKYYANLSSVVDNNMKTIAQHETEIQDIQQSMVRKGEGVEWFTLTLLNGLTTIAGAEFEISKDSTNVVTIRGRANSLSPINNGTVICRIPQGFRPSKTPIFTARGLNSNGQSSPIGVQINRNHEMMLADYSGTTRVDIHIMYKAEQ